MLLSRLAVIALTLACAVIGPLASIALAAQAPSEQQPPVPPTSGRPQGATPPGAVTPVPPDVLTPAEFNRWLEAYALLQAQQQLKLTDEQYPLFIVRLKALQDARRRHAQRRNRLVADLRKLVGPNGTADEASIRPLLDSLAREDETAYEEIKKATAQLDDVLDVTQRARFRVFEERLERRKLDLLSRVRRPVGARPRS